jgi:DNA-binding MarR family transcriptional regulator
MAKAAPNDIQKIRKIKKEDTDINLLILLDQTCSVVTTAVELELKSLRVTQPQVRILSMLSREDRPVTLDELANWTYKEFNSVYTLINRMEKRGLVKKLKKKDDSKTYIIPTEKGSSLYHIKVTEQSIHLVFSKLSDEEKKQLFVILKRVRDTTSDILGLGYKPPFLT